MGTLKTHKLFYAHYITKNEREILSFVKYSHILTKEIKLMECHSLVYDFTNFIAGNFSVTSYKWDILGSDLVLTTGCIDLDLQRTSLFLQTDPVIVSVRL